MTVARSYATEQEPLTSMEIAQEIMECNKTLATQYTTAALEAADPSIRRAFRQMGRDCERVAYRAFEILHEQGLYSVKPAGQADVRQVEEMLDTFLRGQAVPNPTGGTPGHRWGRAPSYAGERERSGYGGGYGADRDRDRDRSELPDWARARV
jgi:hypothetical protein